MIKSLKYEVPILIVAYNRPWMFERVLSAVIDAGIKNIYVQIDGPRELNDHKLIDTNLEIINKFKTLDLTLKVSVLEKNFGIRYSVPRAVNWVLSENDEVIVLEDDAIPAKTFFIFMKSMLRKYKDSEEIFNISGYSCIPHDHLASNTQIRLTKYPDSYAWATWKNKWLIYNDQLPNFFKIKELRILQKKTSNIYEALIWRREFLNARNDLISSWAYRWLYSMWSNDKLSLNCNINLITYVGQEVGSNVTLSQKWSEIPIGEYEESDERPVLSKKSDKWMAKNVYRDSFGELMFVYAITIYLSLRKQYRQLYKYLFD